MNRYIKFQNKNIIQKSMRNISNRNHSKTIKLKTSIESEHYNQIDNLKIQKTKNKHIKFPNIHKFSCVRMSSKNCNSTTINAKSPKYNRSSVKKFSTNKVKRYQSKSISYSKYI